MCLVRNSAVPLGTEQSPFLVMEATAGCVSCGKQLFGLFFLLEPNPAGSAPPGLPKGAGHGGHAQGAAMWTPPWGGAISKALEAWIPVYALACYLAVCQ